MRRFLFVVLGLFVGFELFMYLGVWSLIPF
jgi:phage shock protein PspC (stress-responsive transcriptional regulator)